MKIAKEANARLIVVGVKGVGAHEGRRTHLGSTTNGVLHEAGGTTRSSSYEHLSEGVRPSDTMGRGGGEQPPPRPCCCDAAA